MRCVFIHLFPCQYWGEQLIGKLSYNESRGNAFCSDEDYFLPPLEDTTDAVGDLEDGRHFPRIVVVRAVLFIKSL